MSIELCKKIAGRCKAKYESYSHNGASSFTDAGNLVISPDTVEPIMEEYGSRIFIENMKSLMMYFNLLDKFPSFREKELSGHELRGEVGFPDLMKYVDTDEAWKEQMTLFGRRSAKSHYIFLSRQRLQD